MPTENPMEYTDLVDVWDLTITDFEHQFALRPYFDLVHLWTPFPPFSG
jgi:hypothetical protein